MQRWVVLLAAAAAVAPGAVGPGASAATAPAATAPAATAPAATAPAATAPPAPAAAPPAPAAAPSAAQPDAPGRALVLLVDGSDAMLAPLADGRPRLDAVRDALTGAAADLPEGAVVGLRLAGPDPAVAPPGCADTRPLVPVGPLDRVALGAALAPHVPAGPSSTAEGLRRAVDDLPANVDATVLLVASRLGGCVPGETCAVARELLDRGVGLRVDTVGVAPDPASLEELRCLTDTTGGTLGTAETTPALVSGLTRAALRALSPLAQATVERVPREAGPAVALPPGAYGDVLRPGESRRYLVDVSEGAELLASVSAAAPPEVADRVVLRMSVGDEGARREGAAVLLGTARQALRVRSGPVAESGSPDPTGAGSTGAAGPAQVVPVHVALEQSSGGVVPAVEVPVLLHLDVVDTLLIVEAPEPVVQRLPAPPPERVVVLRERVPTWMWGLVGALAAAVVALGLVVATAEVPPRRRVRTGR